MSTRPGTTEFILEKLRDYDRFSVLKMFGEYALYADGKVVGLICDDILFVKILPASIELESQCEKGIPYHNAKPWYIVEEGELTKIESLREILFALAASIPAKKKKIKKKS